MMVHKHTKIVLLLLILILLSLQVFCKKLKVGALTRRKFKYFIDAAHDNQKNVTTATGFSVDVFHTCIHALPYEVQYELIPFATGSYDDLIKKVYVKEIDAIMGDSTFLRTDLSMSTLQRLILTWV
ncbi:hypothetical protein HanXRQr2_Chr01g0020881 [Helianthus annuus]|uniref:Solute-binding protein family 3/N-terminal domain-containing protein n=1 Tax=Helianthus annuus TaxID=4232 RepID=A0A251VPJ4_HELAN|nr:hypothetical protein HanXRQr2_Chr01g0020881 [Helianthus annuus]KAJ0622608.1 hypothetical protein HanIR_Chr01g0022561 [Helianthus annuus]KAJ0626856.1 hypothetical protein HanHA89_Chr01g0018731 [Helianthus annuus]